MKKPTTIALAILLAVTSATSLSARTKEQQQTISPQAVLDQLMAGNERFTEGNSTNRNYLAEAEETSTGQYPLAVVVSCLDSRVPVEIVFDQGVGDIFVGRVAGNVEDADMVGSLEFATKVAGSKLILVMGHEACGAVKGAIADVKLGNLTQLLEKIQPAMKDVKGVSGPQDASNPAYVDAVVRANVLKTIGDIRALSPVITELEASGDLMIVGAMYELASGKVEIIEEIMVDDQGH